MPYPNEHSCRLEPPDRFVKLRRENNFQGSGYDVIWGITEDGKSTMQAIRYPTGKWTEVKARNHCQEKGGSFHAASQGAQRLENLAIAYGARFEPIIGEDGRTFVKIRAIDTSSCKNKWRVTPEAMRKGANTLLQAKLLGPPPPGEEGDVIETVCPPHIGRWKQVGNFISYEQNGATFGLAEVTEPYAAEKIRSKEWIATSPKIWVNAERKENGEIVVDDYRFDHILFVDQGAFDRVGVVQVCDSSLECGYPAPESLGGALERAFDSFDESFTVTAPTGSDKDVGLHPEKKSNNENRMETDPSDHSPSKEGGCTMTGENEGSQKCITEMQETIKALGARVETLEKNNTDLLKTNDDLKKASDETKAQNKQLMDDKTTREQAEHLAKVNAIVDLRIKAGFVKEEDRAKAVEIFSKMPDAALDLMKPDLEKQVTAVAASAEAAKAKAKFLGAKSDSGLTVGWWNAAEKKWEA